MLEGSIGLPMLASMFHAPGTADPPAQPPQGVGARVVRRFSEWRAALHNAVARRLRLRQPGPRARIAPDADNPPALVPARTPRRLRATPSAPPPGPGCPDWLGWLARLSARSQAAAGVRQRRERRSGPLTLEEFPGIAPEALAFFNTPMEECDPELLHSVFETFAELIEPAMSGRSRAPDVQHVFRALSSRLAAVRAEAPDTPPAAPPEPPASADASRNTPGMSFDPWPEASPELAEAAVIAATNPQETTPDLPDPALPQDPRGGGTRRCRNPTAPAASSVPPTRTPRRKISPTRRRPCCRHPIISLKQARQGRTRRTAAASRRANRGARCSAAIRVSECETSCCRLANLSSPLEVTLNSCHARHACCVILPAQGLRRSLARRTGAPSWRDMHGATAWRSRYAEFLQGDAGGAVRDCERHCHAISTHRCWSPHWANEAATARVQAWIATKSATT